MKEDDEIRKKTILLWYFSNNLTMKLQVKQDLYLSINTKF